VAGVSTWKLDDFNMSMQVERNEVARRLVIVVAYLYVILSGTRASIVPIVLSGVPPIEET
jgi:hypothetical protein